MSPLQTLAILVGLLASLSWITFILGHKSEIYANVKPNTQVSPNVHKSDKSESHKQRILPLCSTLPKSIDEWWYQHQYHIINVTLASQTHSSEEFTFWVKRLWSFYTPARLYRSSAVPAMVPAIKQLLAIADTYPESREPLRILVTGGSITYGHGCSTNHFGIPANETGNNSKTCAWPGRWEKILNDILFHNNPIVQVTNMAFSATSTNITSEILRNRILPSHKGPKTMPHVVVNAHATNDVLTGFSPNENLEMLQEFVQVSNDLRPCDRYLPVVLLVDDLRGRRNAAESMDHSALLYNGLIYGMSTMPMWFDEPYMGT
jgi:hypothetical protein